MSILKRRTSEAEQIELLRQRVHPGTTTICCSECGALRSCRDDSIHQRETLSGPQLYGRCAACSALRSDRAVIAGLLGIEVERGLGLTLVRFWERATAHPDKPNAEPWGHIDREALGQAIAQARAEVAQETTTACRWCGDTRVSEDFGRTEDGWCAACVWHLDRQFEFEDGRRDYVASWLLGLEEQSAPRGLGERCGLVFFHELPAEGQLGWPRPFAWHPDAEVVGWRKRLGLDPPPPSPSPPPAPRTIGRMTNVVTRTKTPVPPKRVDHRAVVRSRRARW